MSDRMTARAVLEAARKKIEKPENWTQGRYEHNGCFCLVGALSAVGGEGPAFEKAYDLLQDAMPVKMSVSLWNDLPGRLHMDVLALIDRALAGDAP